jgi:hypothetical protein
MALPSFTATTKLNESSDTKTIARAFNALVTNLQQIFTSILAKPQLDSVLLKSVTLVAGTNQIPHTLGRAWTGWIVIDTQGENLFYTGAQQDPTTYLSLIANNSGVISLQVF